MKMYLKSISGQVYAMDALPKYTAGYEVVHRDVFVQWCKEHGFTTKEMGDDE